VDTLAPVGIGDADDGALGDRGVARDSVLDLGRVHVLAAGDDHVLDAAHDVEVTLVVEVPPSPVCIQPSRRALAVSSGLFQ
jgi:hypothetical protein